MSVYYHCTWEFLFYSAFYFTVVIQNQIENKMILKNMKSSIVPSLRIRNHSLIGSTNENRLIVPKRDFLYWNYVRKPNVQYMLTQKVFFWWSPKAFHLKHCISWKQKLSLRWLPTFIFYNKVLFDEEWGPWHLKRTIWKKLFSEMFLFCLLFSFIMTWLIRIKRQITN